MQKTKQNEASGIEGRARCAADARRWCCSQCSPRAAAAADRAAARSTAPTAQAEKPASRAEAARFLTQATFGPTDADIDRVLAIGYSAWIDEQFAKPASTNRAALGSRRRGREGCSTPNNSVDQDGTINAFWRNAISADDQLRQRVAYSLSQIFVISMQDGTVGDNPRAVAAYLDMLGDKGLGNYRDLLEAVSQAPDDGRST